MWKLIAALPPSSLSSAMSSPPDFAFLCSFVYSANPLWLISMEALSPVLPPSRLYSPVCLSARLSSSTIAASFHLAIFLWTDSFTPTYLSFAVPFPSCKHHLYSPPSSYSLKKKKKVKAQNETGNTQMTDRFHKTEVWSGCDSKNFCSCERSLRQTARRLLCDTQGVNGGRNKHCY